MVASMWVAAVQVVKVVEFQIYFEHGASKIYSQLEVGSEMRAAEGNSWKREVGEERTYGWQVKSPRLGKI